MPPYNRTAEFEPRTPSPPDIMFTYFSNSKLRQANNEKIKAKVDRDMLHHRTDATDALIGGGYCQTRSKRGPQVKQLTKIPWHLIAPPFTM